MGKINVTIVQFFNLWKFVSYEQLMEAANRVKGNLGALVDSSESWRSFIKRLIEVSDTEDKARATFMLVLKLDDGAGDNLHLKDATRNWIDHLSQPDMAPTYVANILQTMQENWCARHLASTFIITEALRGLE